MNKPITLVHAELVQNITNEINNSGLPFFIIESVLKDIYLEAKSLSKKQYESDFVKYEALKAEEQPSELDE